MASDNGRVLAEVAPGSVKRIHLVGVAGTGMGAFAGMLKASGYQVTGSDQNIYPPMSDLLRELAVDVYSPYAAANLDRARPDLVIIGNVVRRDNAEATAVRERGLAQMSFPAAFAALLLANKHSVVVAGTHGKTTTAALMAHVLVSAGQDASFLIGGVAQNSGANFRLGAGPHVVIEGDEYDTAYFDKGPKFLHYRARTAILTSIEFDHADIYRDLAHYESAYERFCETLPPDGLLVVSASYPRAIAIARARATCRVTTYAVNGKADFRADQERFATDGARFRIHTPQDTTKELLLPMSGYHNLENAAGVYAAARALGLTPAEIAKGFASFAGVKRRQEVRGEVGGILVIDDFAHHPTAVRETIEGIRQRYPDRRIWAVFEPRSNTSRRNVHQTAYIDALAGADAVTLREPEPHDMVPAAERLDVGAVVAGLATRGVVAQASPDVADLVRHVADGVRPNDLVLVMSNGAFGGFIQLLMDDLVARAKQQLP